MSKKRKWTLYGPDYDDLLFNYINATKYPDKVEWNKFTPLCAPINCYSRDGRFTPIQCLLYRATDYNSLINLRVGDTVRLMDRFYSWTDKFTVAVDILNYYIEGVILKIKGDDIIGIDLRKINQTQSEVLLPPNEYIVTDISSVHCVRVVTIKLVNCS